MGSDDEVNSLPIHEVEVPSFELLKTEVTMAQYALCVDAGVCGEPTTPNEYCLWRMAGLEGIPMHCITWAEAAAWCAWVEGRLPSEAEWEFAARSRGLAYDYPWGDERATCDRAVMDDPEQGSDGCGLGRVWEPCSRSPLGDSEQGVCDLAGNAWEWVQDVYHASYDDAPTDGSAWKDGDDTARITRGGSTGNEADKLKATFRDYAVATNGGVPGLGFRCAR